MIVKEKYIKTAGGRITCLRCQAMSKRSGEQCKKNALKQSRTQKCDFHGGRSKGPTSTAGKEASRLAHIKSGAYTKKAILNQQRALLNLANLEAGLHILGMTSASWTRGRRPNGYKKITTIEELKQVIAEPVTL
jgi:hypothetical protein